MKHLIAVMLTLSLTSCLPWQKPTLRDVDNLAMVACTAAKLVPEELYEGKSAKYWCDLVGVTLDVVEEITDANN